MTLSIANDPLTDFVHVEHLPRLEIVSVESVQRNCYSEVTYRVRSLVRLTPADFDYLLDKHFFMHGQGFFIESPHDGSETIAGRWTVDGSVWVTFYEYRVTCSCDSSD